MGTRRPPPPLTSPLSLPGATYSLSALLGMFLGTLRSPKPWQSTVVPLQAHGAGHALAWPRQKAAQANRQVPARSHTPLLLPDGDARCCFGAMLLLPLEAAGRANEGLPRRRT